VVLAPAPPLPFSNVVARRQDLPRLPSSLAGTKGQYRGTIEVEINEAGNVVGARIIQSVHVLYDPLLLVAARDWKYEPARIDGRPMAVRKRVGVVLKP
jgi:TonB family protein